MVVPVDASVGISEVVVFVVPSVSKLDMVVCVVVVLMVVRVAPSLLSNKNSNLGVRYILLIV